MATRGIRGATLLSADSAEEMSEAVGELVEEMMRRNRIGSDDVISILFTATPDIRSAFPAAAARSVGLVDVPLICAQEIDVAGAIPRAIRVLMHAESSQDRADIEHVYLRGAEVLRPDISS